jgi:hypothetical protein
MTALEVVGGGDIVVVIGSGGAVIVVVGIEVVESSVGRLVKPLATPTTRDKTMIMQPVFMLSVDKLSIQGGW